MSGLPPRIQAGLHRVDGGHLVTSRSIVAPLRSRDNDGRLMVGMGATVRGAIRHAGSVTVSRASKVWGGIVGGYEVVLGAGTQVDGDLRADGRIVIQHGSIVKGRIEAGGDVHLLGHCVVGDVKAGGDIVVVGSPRTGALQPGGRISTRPW